MNAPATPSAGLEPATNGFRKSPDACQVASDQQLNAPNPVGATPDVASSGDPSRNRSATGYAARADAGAVASSGPAHVTSYSVARASALEDERRAFVDAAHAVYVAACRFAGCDRRGLSALALDRLTECVAQGEALRAPAEALVERLTAERARVPAGEGADA